MGTMKPPKKGELVDICSVVRSEAYAEKKKERRLTKREGEKEKKRGRKKAKFSKFEKRDFLGKKWRGHFLGFFI